MIQLPFVQNFQKGFAVTTSLIDLGINFFFLYEWVGATSGLTPVSISITTFLSLIYVLTIIYLSYYCLVAMGIIRRLKW
ncbi:hypothetical protein V3C99_003061, partial [Haemonchus contortus]